MTQDIYPTFTKRETCRMISDPLVFDQFPKRMFSYRGKFAMIKSDAVCTNKYPKHTAFCNALGDKVRIAEIDFTFKKSSC